MAARSRGRAAVGWAVDIEIDHIVVPLQTLAGLFDGLYVRQILGPAGRALVLEERLAAQITHKLSTELPARTTCPSLLETDAIDGGDQIDAIGRNSQLDNVARMREV